MGQIFFSIWKDSLFQKRIRYRFDNSFKDFVFLVYTVKGFIFLWRTMKDFVFFRYTMENFVLLLQTMKDFVFLRSQLFVYVESCFYEIHSIQRKLTHLCKKETSRHRFGDRLFSFGSAGPFDLVFCIECCRKNRL